MRFFDTALGCVATWEPPQDVRIYVCGITPYDSAHLGHIFTFMTYDLLQRYLEDQGHTVTMVRNITDVDEPIFKKAAELGELYGDLATRETAAFQDVLAQLNFRRPAHEPLASQYIEPMALAVSQLLASGHAYFVGKDIYFDTVKDPQFGSFSGFGERLRMGLLTMRGGDPSRVGKRDPLDFQLWRTITDPADLAAWTTAQAPLVPRGRPGWHIECSVMSSSLLGTPFDLHGGGYDLIFPHHESEIAQTRALNPDEPLLARRWLHVAPIHYCGEKMSKSLGNLVFARDLLEKHEPSVIRLALMNYSHRMGGEWIPGLLIEATDLLQRIRESVQSGAVGAVAVAKFGKTVRAALADDLDMHAVVHALECLADSCASATKSNPSEKPIEKLRQTFDMLGLVL